MKKILLMLAVATLGTGAMAQTPATTAAGTQTQTAHVKRAPAKPAAEVKSAEPAKVNNDKNVGAAHKKSHKHAIRQVKNTTK